MINKYDDYKYSGFKWIGLIPKLWQCTYIKHVLSIPITDGPHITPELIDTGIPFISAEAIKGGKIDFTKKRGNISLEDYNLFSQKYIPLKGDIYMIKSGATTGNVAMLESDIKFTIWSPLAVFRADRIKVIPKYLHYFLQSSNFRYSVEVNWSYGTQQNIGMGVLSNLIISFPFIEEQNKIIKFLDYQTAIIDDLIAKKERLIDLLKEKRQAVINEAVTKGLDPNAKMKDSGIEWLGEVNSKWSIKKIKHTTTVKGRIGWQNLRAEDFRDEGPYLVTGTDFDKGAINWDNCHRVDEDRFWIDSNIILQENDVLITKDGTIGKISIVKNKPEKATLNSGIFVTRPIKNQYIPDYFYWLLNSDVFTHFIDFNKSGATIQHLYQNVFIEFSFALPDLTEQNNIIIYLNNQTSKIDLIRMKCINNIERLKEYRQSIISEAVTGKIDVRKWEPTKVE